MLRSFGFLTFLSLSLLLCLRLRCISADGYCNGTLVNGTGSCLYADVTLVGDRVMLGIANAGSFGQLTPGVLNLTSLGLISDISDTGFTSSIPYAGDYFTFNGIEGWGLQWNESSGSQFSRTNFGMLGQNDLATKCFSITSRGNLQSAIWTGFDPYFPTIALYIVMDFDQSGLFVRTTYTMKNIQVFNATNVYFYREMQSRPQFHLETLSGVQPTDLLSFVKYQPAALDKSDCCLDIEFVKEDSPYTALVYQAASANLSYHIGFGTIHPAARTNFHDNVNSSPECMRGDTASNCTLWQEYGGRNMTIDAADMSRMMEANQPAYLSYFFDAMQGGECVHFSMVHITSQDVEAEALRSISIPYLLQPVDLLSGSAYLFSALVTECYITKCDFNIFANTSSTASAWYNLGSVSFAPDSNVTYCQLYGANITSFTDGYSHVSVNITTSGGYFTADRAVMVFNTGAKHCFTTTDNNGTMLFFANTTTSLSTQKCPGTLGYVKSVSYFLEYWSGVVMMSTLIVNIKAAPFTIYVNVSGIPNGTPVTIKAVTNSGVSNNNARIMAGVVVSNVTANSTSQLCFADVAPTGVPSPSPSTLPSSSPSSSIPTNAPSTSTPTSAPTLVVSSGGYCENKFVAGTDDCSNGDIALVGNNIILGVNNAGSFGSESVSVLGLFPLGLIADTFKAGWDSTSAPYSGDYFAFTMIEGFTVQWTTESASGDPQVNSLTNQGLQAYAQTPTALFAITSSPGIQSALWVGKGDGSLAVSAVTHFSNTGMFIRTSVTLKNEGSIPMNDIYYLRAMTATPELHLNGNYSAGNYVKYQPLALDGSDGFLNQSYVKIGQPNAALVYTVGLTNMSYLMGLGALSSHARVSHFGVDSFNPVQTYGDNNGSREWTSYGGRDMVNNATYLSRMHVGLEGAYLTFKYNSLQPGEVALFNIFHLVNEEFEADALGIVAVLMQPTDIISGSMCQFSALVTQFTILQCNFSIFAVRSDISNQSDWYSMGSVSIDPTSSVTQCSLYANSSMFQNGNVQVLVSILTNGGQFIDQRAAIVGNTGVSYCFDSSDFSGTYGFYTNQSTRLSLSLCPDSPSLPASISFFLESYTDDEMKSSLISVSSSGPYIVDIGVSSFAIGTFLSVKAVTASTLGSVVHVFSGVVLLGMTPSPSTLPTALPSLVPTLSPSLTPSVSPSTLPTNAPTFSPTSVPSFSPVVPSEIPSANPTSPPSHGPTFLPSSTAFPTLTPSYSGMPSKGPTTIAPSCFPSSQSPSRRPPRNLPTQSTVPTADASNTPTAMLATSASPSGTSGGSASNSAVGGLDSQSSVAVYAASGFIFVALLVACVVYGVQLAGGRCRRKITGRIQGLSERKLQSFVSISLDENAMAVGRKQQGRGKDLLGEA